MGHPDHPSLEEQYFMLCLFLCFVFMNDFSMLRSYRSLRGEGQALEHVTHLTNYSKLFELRVGKFALSSEGFGNSISNLHIVEMPSRLLRCANTV